MTTKRRAMGPTFEPDPEPVMEGPPRPPRPSSPSHSVSEGPARPPRSSSPSSPTTEGPARPPRPSSPSQSVSEGPARPSSSSSQPPQRRRVMGPSLEDDEPPSAPPVEGPARPPSDPSSQPQRRRVMGPSLDDDDEPPVMEGPARPPGYTRPEPPSDIEPPSQGRKRALDRGPSIGPTIGPSRPTAAQQFTEEDEEEQERLMRANEWDTVKKAPAKVVKREEWMTELPPERSANPTALITNRQFSRKDNVTGRGDTSSWTDTPADKEKKKHKVNDAKNLKEVAHADFVSQKDEANAKIIAQYNKQYRSKSLAEEHQEILKKKQAEAKPEDEPLWKPFDRTTDLEARMSNPAATQKMIKNAQNLNTRFGASNSKRFL